MNDTPQKREEHGRADLQSREPSRRRSEAHAGALHRRAFLAAGAGAAVLLADRSSAQVQSPVVSGPAGPEALPGNVRVERVDGSILLIGIRQETERVELSSV